MIKVADGIVSVVPLTAVTTPVMRSEPEPCTLLPAKTSVAANDTSVEEVLPVVVPVVVVVPVLVVVVVVAVLLELKLP